MDVRLLLVHANPLQRVLPVPPYGLERVAAAASASGVDVRILDPYLLADDAPAAAAAAAAAFRPHAVGLGVRVLEDCIPVGALEADGDADVDVYPVVPELRALRRELRLAAPDALTVLGGAGFSAAPQACLDELDVDWGVVGAGEAAIAAVARAGAEGRAPDALPGLVRRGQHGTTAYALPPAGAPPPRREPRYAPTHGVPVRARVGCAMACSYCTAATLGRRHAVDGLPAVLDEIERAVADGRGRGLPHVPLFLCADELNLPSEGHAVALLRGLQERGLASQLSWRAYFNPAPFSDELAALVAATNGHVSLTVDSASDRVLAANGKPFRRRHLDALVERLRRHGVSADVGLIFGLPGEDEDTLAETLAWVRSVPPALEVAYATGARVYEGTPLASAAAAAPERVWHGAEAGRLTPAVYSALGPPRELARRLDRDLADVPHAELLGVGYRRSSQALSAAYRALEDGGGRDAWNAALRSAAAAPEGFRLLRSCLEIALWHRRWELAAESCSALLACELPAGLAAGDLRSARRTYRALGLAARVGRAGRARGRRTRS